MIELLKWEGKRKEVDEKNRKKYKSLWVMLFD